MIFFLGGDLFDVLLYPLRNVMDFSNIHVVVVVFFILLWICLDQCLGNVGKHQRWYLNECIMFKYVFSLTNEIAVEYSGRGSYLWHLNFWSVRNTHFGPFYAGKCAFESTYFYISRCVKSCLIYIQTHFSSALFLINRWHIVMNFLF